MKKFSKSPNRSRSPKPLKLSDYAKQVAGTIQGEVDPEIDGVCAIEESDPQSLTFATNETYLRAALASRAAAVLTDPATAATVANARKPLLLVASPRVALAALLAQQEPPRPQGPFRHPSAVIDPTADLADDIVIGALVVVGCRAVIGAGTILHAGVIIGADARTGAGCTFHPRAALLDRCIVGDRVVLQAGAVVGSDGFGYVFVDAHFAKIPQIGNVVLGDDVEIGANTCVDRAQTGSTQIGCGTKIDNLCQIGHNTRIGKHCAFAAQNGLAGTTVVGDYVLAGGQAGFKGHLTVGSRVRVAGRAQVWSDIPDDAAVGGAPAQDHRTELRQQVRVRKLDKLYARVDALEHR